MKVTRARYERALQKIKSTEADYRTTQEWEQPIQQLGLVGDKRVISVQVTKYGTINVEFDPRAEHGEVPVVALDMGR